MEFNNKLKPIKPKAIKTNYSSFVNPFRDDKNLSTKTFEEIRDVFKNDYKIDLLDAIEGESDTNYRGKAWEHYAPSPSDITNEELDEYSRRVAPLTDLSTIYPKLYNPEENEMDLGDEIMYEYGTDGRDYSDYKMDQATNEILQKTRNNPEAEVMIYRVMPKGKNIINTGDWVTINLQYALMFFDLVKEHASNNKKLPKDYHIVSKKVKAKDLFSGKRDSTDDIHSFGYYPQK
jgi:hypothetical protein